MDCLVAIKTGNVEFAATNAAVYMRLTGSAGSTPEISINKPNYNDRKRGALDTYYISTDDVGDLINVRLRHSNSGTGPGWFIENLLVTRSSDGKAWEVHPQTWLATNSGGIDRVFALAVANAQFDLGTVYAAMVNLNQTERKTIYIDPRARNVTVALEYGATSALLEGNSGDLYYAAGNATLPAGGDYQVSVGSYYIGHSGSSSLPRVKVTYNRLKA